MYLLDTSVLFAYLYQGHASHVSASSWLSTTKQFATCGLTQVGVFRLFLTSAAMNGCPLEPSDAHALVVELAGDARHQFIPCPPLARDYVGQTTGAKAAFDDYLIQIAVLAGFTFATLDVALTRRWPSHTYLVS